MGGGTQLKPVKHGRRTYATIQEWRKLLKSDIVKRVM